MSPAQQIGPGYVLTTHGPVMRAMPPWDVPAGPDYPDIPRGALGDPESPVGPLDVLDAEIARLEASVERLRDLRAHLTR